MPYSSAPVPDEQISGFEGTVLEALGRWRRSSRARPTTRVKTYMHEEAVVKPEQQAAQGSI